MTQVPSKLSATGPPCSPGSSTSLRCIPGERSSFTFRVLQPSEHASHAGLAIDLLRQTPIFSKAGVGASLPSLRGAGVGCSWKGLATLLASLSIYAGPDPSGPAFLLRKPFSPPA